jgi:hypothetical protein
MGSNVIDEHRKIVDVVKTYDGFIGELMNLNGPPRSCMVPCLKRTLGYTVARYRMEVANKIDDSHDLLSTANFLMKELFGYFSDAFKLNYVNKLVMEMTGDYTYNMLAHIDIYQSELKNELGDVYRVLPN